MRPLRLTTSLACLVLLAACARGGPDDPARRDTARRDGARRTTTSTSATATKTETSAPPAGTSPFVVEVVVDGTYSKGVVHVIRVERPDGKQVFERTLGPDRRLTEAMAPGDYRVLSFQRQCKTTCGSDPKADQLGAPVDVCGSYFALTASAPTKATVKLVPEESCEISFS